MRISRASLALVAALWSTAARANGGGYEYGVQFTGSVAPFQASGTEHVRIEEENLDVALRRTQAIVTVRYTMRNVSAKPVKVRFGFPVEATTEEMGDCEDGTPELNACKRKDLARSIQQLHGYAVTADGQPVKAEFRIEPFAEGKVRPFEGSEKLAGIVGWMVSEVAFPADRAVALEIRYAADYAGGVSYISDDAWEEARSFKYRLSTGEVWNGTIARGTITVRADGIAPEEVRIEAGNLERDGDRWVRRFEDLEPTLADDIDVVAIPQSYVPYTSEEPPAPYESYLARGAQENHEYRQWGGRHRQFKATASSVLRAAPDHTFGPEHLRDDGPYPWAEGAPGWGIGEWVELTSAKPRPLVALRIWSGFQARDDKAGLFEKNGRPSRVEIVLNGEHRFVATLGDVKDGQLVPIVGYAKPVSKIRITILEVYPGTKYEDTCIAKVVLYDLLSKPPQTYGSR